MTHAHFSAHGFTFSERRLLRQAPAGPDMQPGAAAEAQRQAIERASNQFVQRQVEQRLANVPNGYLYGRHIDPLVGPYAQHAAAPYQQYGAVHGQPGFGGRTRYNFPPNTPYAVVDSPRVATHAQPEFRFLQGTMGSPFKESPFPDKPAALPGVQQMPGSPLDPYVNPYGRVSPYHTHFRWYPEDAPSYRLRMLESQGGIQPGMTVAPAQGKSAVPKKPVVPARPVPPAQPQPKPNPQPAPHPPAAPQENAAALTDAEKKTIADALQGITKPNAESGEIDRLFRTIHRWDVGTAGVCIGQLKDKGISLVLQAKALTPKVAAVFAKHDASIYLEGVPDPGVLSGLHEFTNNLYLSGVKTLGGSLGDVLKGAQYASLSLPVLIELDEKGAEGLAALQNGQVEISSAVSLTGNASAAAEKLGTLKFLSITLKADEFNTDIAEKISERIGHLSLDIQGDNFVLTEDQARFLGRCPKLTVWVKSIDDRAMKALAGAATKPDSQLKLPYVRQINDATAAAIRTHPGVVELGLKTITAKQVDAILGEKTKVTQLWLYDLVLDDIKDDAELRTALKAHLTAKKVFLYGAVLEWVEK